MSDLLKKGDRVRVADTSIVTTDHAGNISGARGTILAVEPNFDGAIYTVELDPPHIQSIARLYAADVVELTEEEKADDKKTQRAAARAQAKADAAASNDE
jgi:hypothetical protein